MHEAITIGEFVGLLWEGLTQGHPRSAMLWAKQGQVGGETIADKPAPGLDAPTRAAGDLELLEMARLHGWAEPQDVRLAGEVLRRNDAARLIHEFLKCELGEADEENWNAAKSLADLYDCHACVHHVAQAFCKGIMTAKGQAFGIREGQVVGMPKGQAFGMREPVTYEEAREVAERVFHKELRHVPGTPQAGQQDSSNLDGRELQAENVSAGSAENATQNAEALPRRLTEREAAEFLAEHPDTLLVDVRTRGEFDAGHPDGAVNIPLLKLLEAPRNFLDKCDVAQSLLDKGNVPILLTCDAGYRAEIAATKLCEAGLKNVSYIGRKQ